jgi:hypothetical protein
MEVKLEGGVVVKRCARLPTGSSGRNAHHTSSHEVRLAPGLDGIAQTGLEVDDAHHTLGHLIGVLQRDGTEHAELHVRMTILTAAVCRAAEDALGGTDDRLDVVTRQADRPVELVDDSCAVGTLDGEPVEAGPVVSVERANLIVRHDADEAGGAGGVHCCHFHSV